MNSELLKHKIDLFFETLHTAVYKAIENADLQELFDIIFSSSYSSSAKKIAEAKLLEMISKVNDPRVIWKRLAETKMNGRYKTVEEGIRSRVEELILGISLEGDLSWFEELLGNIHQIPHVFIAPFIHKAEEIRGRLN